MKLIYKATTMVLVILLLASCEAKKIVGEGTVNTSLTAKKIVKNHYTNALDFKTIKGKLKVKYNDGDSSNSFGVSLRMEKDKAIWISEATFGLVKAYITPNGVSFYNKLDNTYFEGDFSYISNLLGTELDFDKLQNVLLGQAIVDMKKDKYGVTVGDNRYQLKPEQSLGAFKLLFLVEPKYYKMSLQQVSQPAEGRVSSISYDSYQDVDGQAFPDKVSIKVEDSKGITGIDIEYKKIELNEKVTFPYNIPSGYSLITLEK
ncbi:DUF4292 domain-containing protein [Neptunitalea chrysea]|nr:DUF4292 domain-containing protein [Neptunitalea chrysea]